MLTCWLIFTALLSASVSPAKATVAVAPIRRVEAQRKAELTLQCGDGNPPGQVQYWHTPIGDHQPGSHSKPEPGYMQQEGRNLVLSNISSVHSGLYYCLLQHTDGITLWLHDLRVSPESSERNPPSGHGAGRSRRDVGSVTERQGHFAGAVVGSVLLTFVVGFSAGALCRSQVLKCLEALMARLRSPKAQPHDEPDHASEVSMTTMSSMCHSHVVEIEQAGTATSSTASVPPAKPQRSFRENRQDDREMVDNLNGCEGQTVWGEGGEESMEVTNEEERRERSSEKIGADECDSKEMKDKEEGEEGEKGNEESGDDGEKGPHERKQWRDEEREAGDLEELNTFSDGGKECKEECEAAKANEEIDEQVNKEGKEMKKAFREEKGENSGQEDGSGEGEPGRGNCEETDGIREEEDRWREEREREEEEESPVTGQPPRPPAPRPGRPSRVIRLYEYDEEGQPYGHVLQAGADEPGPAPRLQQRSISLTRLSAIMAAASAGPLDCKDAERAERSNFYMEM